MSTEEETIPTTDLALMDRLTLRLGRARAIADLLEFYGTRQETSPELAPGTLCMTAGLLREEISQAMAEIEGWWEGKVDEKTETPHD